MQTTATSFAAFIIAAILTLNHAHANERAMEALRSAATKPPEQVFDTYFGEALAATAAGGGNVWKRYTKTQKKAQVAHARRKFIANAGRFTKYKNTKFKWHGDVATFSFEGKNGQATVSVGSGCKIRNVCVKGLGCLSDIIGKIPAEKNR